MRSPVAVLLCTLVSIPALPHESLTNAATSANTPADVPAGISADWWGAVQEDIAAAEYHVTWQEDASASTGAYQAPNRAQGLRTWFTPEGIHVVPRAASDAPAWEWKLALVRYGDGVTMQSADPAELSASGARIEYRREALTEWYVNEERGLEQGFTVSAHPTSAESESLVLELAISGTLQPTAASEGAPIELVSEDGATVLAYSDLYAFDSTGKSLPASMHLEESTLRLSVDTRGARWPVTIDPLASSPNWTRDVNQASARFGYSVMTAGDVNGDNYSDVIVGAPYYDNGQSNEGRVYVYHGSSHGLPTTPAWTAESNQASADFGVAVATAGDVNGDGYSDVIVGADYYDNGQAEEGRAFVFHGSASGLSGAPNWTAESDQAGGFLCTCFGGSVMTAGDVNGDGYSDVIIGAALYDNTLTDEGRAYLYHGGPGGLAATAAWIANGGQASASYGRSVSTAGDTNGDGYTDVIVGSNFHDNGHTDEGRAYVYLGTATGLSTTPVWTAEPDQASAYFGTSVATAGDMNGDGYAEVVVGAPSYDSGQTNEGAAWVYSGTSTGPWPFGGTRAESNQANASFGTAVGTAGDVNGDGYADLIVGASGYDKGQTDEGVAFVYHGAALLISLTASWTGESNQASALFGRSVGTAGDVNGDGFSDVIVGAHYYDNGETDEGRAYVYNGAPAGLSSISGWVAFGEEQGAEFATAVNTAGDVNGDGYADVIVGATGAGAGGRAYLYLGSSAGLPLLSPSWSWDGPGDGTFGYSVNTAGDVNGDGYADVVISDGSGGLALSFLGSSSGLSEAVSWVDDYGDDTEANAATAGDVNGDGYADVIVGTPLLSVSGCEGYAYVYHGSSTGLHPAPDWSVAGDCGDYRFLGRSVATAGDVNGDGYSDVVVNAADIPNTPYGRAYVYLGSASGLSTEASWSIQATGDSNLGWSMASAGDVNGDGYSDVIAGDPYYENGQYFEGRAVLYLGSASGLSPVANWSVESNQEVAFFGYAVRSAGDVNGDGYADVIVGAPSSNQAGSARVYLGRSSGLATSASWTGQTGQPMDSFGLSVGTAGDVNGDGYAEVIVGAPRYDGALPDTGMALLFQGNASVGLSLRPRQLRTDNSEPIAQLGQSDSASSFRLALLGRTPFGRGKVKLQWEVKSVPTKFNGTSLQQSASWMDTGVNGADISELVPKAPLSLRSNRAHHWRVRLLYHPATTPFQHHSRWLTTPWNGWNEERLRTDSN